MSRSPSIRTQSTRKASTKKLDLDQHGSGLIGGLISLFFGVIISIVALRFIFRLLGANADNSIVSWIYNASQPLVSPFFGIFGHDVNLLTGRFELDTLIALIVYGIIASVLSNAFGGYRRTHTV
jgi:hypothetical protein